MALSAVRKAKHSFLMTMTSLIWSPKQFWSAYHSLMPNYECIPHTLTNGIITAESPTAKANLLNSYFCSCFTIPPSRTSTPTLSTPLCSHPDLSTMNAHRQKLRSCCVPSASRLLQALTEYLRTCSETQHSQYHLLSTSYSISPCQLTTSAQTGRSLTSPLSSNLGLKAHFLTSYRPISLLSIPSKLLDCTVHNRLLIISSLTLSSPPDSIDSDQAAQPKRHSCLLPTTGREIYIEV